MDLNSKSYVTVPVSNHNNPIAIDYDNIDGRIYWTDVGSKQIRSASINGNSEKTVRILANSRSKFCSVCWHCLTLLTLGLSYVLTVGLSYVHFAGIF